MSALPAQAVETPDFDLDDFAPPSKLPSTIPCERIRPLIDALLQRGETLRGFGVRAGVPERTLTAVMRSERQSVTFNVADRIVCALPSGPLIWHMPAPDGLADLYGADTAEHDEGATA
jgi:hypothetical protein